MPTYILFLSHHRCETTLFCFVDFNFKTISKDREHLLAFRPNKRYMSKKVDIFGPLYKPNASTFVDMSFIKKRVLNIKLLICNIYLSHIIWLLLLLMKYKLHFFSLKIVLLIIYCLLNHLTIHTYLFNLSHCHKNYAFIISWKTLSSN